MRKRVVTGKFSELSGNIWRDLGKFYCVVTQRTLILGWEHHESTTQGEAVD